MFLCLFVFAVVMFFVYYFSGFLWEWRFEFPTFNCARKSIESLIVDDELVYGAHGGSALKLGIPSGDGLKGKNNSARNIKENFKTPDYGKNDREYLDKIIKTR